MRHGGSRQIRQPAGATYAPLRPLCPLWVKRRHFGMSDGCLLYSQKHTSRRAVVMSALCQNRPLAKIRLCARKDFNQLIFGNSRVALGSQAPIPAATRRPPHQYRRRSPRRLIAVFATYASPTIATSFGRYRKLLHLRAVATIGCLTARPTANRPVQLSHRSS